MGNRCHLSANFLSSPGIFAHGKLDIQHIEQHIDTKEAATKLRTSYLKQETEALGQRQRDKQKPSPDIEKRMAGLAPARNGDRRRSERSSVMRRFVSLVLFGKSGQIMQRCRLITFGVADMS